MPSEPTKQELTVPRPDLQKTFDVLERAVKHHEARDEMNAHLHLASQCRLSPLTSELGAARDRLDGILNG